MFAIWKRLSKRAAIALHAEENRSLKEGLFYNLLCDALYGNYPNGSSIKERITDGETEYKILVNPFGTTRASIVVRENGVHTGTLVHHYQDNEFSVIDPITGSGRCDIHALYPKVMRLAEIDAARRGRVTDETSAMAQAIPA